MRPRPPAPTTHDASRPRGAAVAPPRLAAALSVAVLVLAVLVLAVLAPPAFAAPGDAHDLPRDLRFRHLTVADGLAQSSVHSLLQDRLGFVWIGTEDGLQRYDGERFLRFAADPFRPDGLSHSMVHSLHEDARGRLWIGSLGGLDLWSSATGRFEPLLETPLAQAASWPVSDLAEDASGRLWIATRDQGVVVAGADGEVLRHLRAADGTLASDRVQALATDPSGGVWIGFADAAPVLLAGLTADGLEKALAVEGLASVDVRDIAVHASGVFLATAAGLVRLERVDGAPRILESHRPDAADESSLGGSEVEAVLVDSRGRLWAGGSFGLDLHLGDGRFRHFRHRPGEATSLGHDHVQTLLEDAGGLIWAGTALGGVTLLDLRPRFERVSAAGDEPGDLPSSVVHAFAEDAAGRLWIGTQGGLCQRVGSACAVPAPDAESSTLGAREAVWSLRPAAGGGLWIGGQEALHFADPDDPSRNVSYRHDPASPSSLGPGSIRALAEDDDGRLWVALFGGGLDRLAPGEQRFEHFRHRAERPFSLPSDLTFTLLRDRRGHLWVGTAAGLARRTADGRFHSYHQDSGDRSSLLGDLVRAIHQDGEGNLWVGTDAGLNRLPAELVHSPPVPAPNNRGFTHFTEADGLPDNSVNAIVEDTAGRLWLSTHRGLSRFEPSTGTFTTFDPQDGLVGFELGAGAAMRSADGRIYVGGLGGYNVFRPSDIVVNDHVPPVRFTELVSIGRHGETTAGPLRGDAGATPIWLAEEIELSPRDLVVRLGFAALDYAQPSTNRYAYRLEGRDPEWHDLGTEGTVTLAGLEAGDYRLRVRGSNDDGVWNETGASLEVSVLPPWWRAGWAFAAYATLAVLLLGLVAVQRTRRRALAARVDDVVRLSERRLQLALEGSGDGLWDWNVETDELFRWGLAEMLGFDATELPPDASWRQRFIHPDDRPRVEEALEAHLRGQTPRFEAEYRVRDGGGSWRWILDRGNIVERGELGEPVRMAGTFKDMTRHKKIERELRLWSTVFEAIDEGVMVLGAEGQVRAVNDAFCRLFGRPRHSLLGRPASRLRSPAHDDAFYRRMRRELLVHGTWRGEIQQPRTDGERLVWVEIRAVDDPKAHLADGAAPATAEDTDRRRGRSSHYVVVVSDITRRKRAEAELRYLADYDPLTGLPNRSMFNREAAAAVAAAQDDDRGLAILFTDLDGFKHVNDTLGHPVGDQLLQEAARRLLTSVRTDDLVARLGGDELIILLHDPSGRGVIDRDSVSLVARRILGAFTPSFLLDGHDLSASTSIGIALFPDHGDDVETLLKHADTAMYEAKAQGRNRFSFYTHEMGDRALTRMTLDHRLRRALPGGDLTLYYQPIFDLARGELVGVEALLRWPQQDGDVWLPETFLEVAEDSGLVLPLGAWVLETACDQAATWRRAGKRLGISVNLSSAQLDHDDLVEQVRGTLESSGLEPEHLCLEITEDAVMERTEERLSRLEELRRLGLRLSIDDFGTGFSSLGHLQRLPFDELKIDRSFVEKVSDRDASSIARTILAMAEGMEVDVVAEGVETEEQLDILGRLGCRRIQGYLISKPLPADELEALMSSTEAPWRRLAVSRRRRARASGGKGTLRPVK